MDQIFDFVFDFPLRHPSACSLAATVIGMTIIAAAVAVAVGAGFFIAYTSPNARFLWVIIKSQLLPGLDISNRKEREFINPEIGVVDHDREDPAIRITRMVYESRRTAVTFAVDLIDRLPLEFGCTLEEIEAEYVAWSVVIGVREGFLAETFAFDERLGGYEFADVCVDELAAGDGPGGAEAEAVVRSHKDVQGEGTAELNDTVCAGGGGARTEGVAFLDLNDFAGVGFAIEEGGREEDLTR